MLQEASHFSLRLKDPQEPPAPLTSTTKLSDRIFGAATHPGASFGLHGRGLAGSKGVTDKGRNPV